MQLFVSCDLIQARERHFASVVEDSVKKISLDCIFDYLKMINTSEKNYMLLFLCFFSFLTFFLK